MTGFLVDTNVLSEFNRRGGPDPLVKQWLEAADTASLYVSVLTLAEIRFGVELLPASKRRTQLESWLDRDLPAWFGSRILPVDRSIADRWGMLRAKAQLKGRQISIIDGLLAATALEHGLTIVSRKSISQAGSRGLASRSPSIVFTPYKAGNGMAKLARFTSLDPLCLLLTRFTGWTECSRPRCFTRRFRRRPGAREGPRRPSPPACAPCKVFAGRRRPTPPENPCALPPPGSRSR